MKRRRGSSCLLAAGLGCAGLVPAVSLHSGAASAAGPAPAARVTLLAQTPWVEGHGNFRLRVAVDATHPATDRVQVLGYSPTRTRTDFTSAAQGHVNGYAFYSTTVPLTKLPTDPAGGVDIDIPVDQAPVAGSPIGTFEASGDASVNPVQIRVVDARGAAQGPDITTFLVWARGPQAITQHGPLSVALIVPVSTRPSLDRVGKVEPPGPAEAARLDKLSSFLEADASVPAALLTAPLTAVALTAGAEAGSPMDRDALAQLAAAPQGGLLQVLPATYSPVSVGDLEAAGLGGEVDRQMAAGTGALSSLYGVVPDSRTWVSPGPLDGTTLSALLDRHVTQVIVPEADLTPLPAAATYLGLTFAKPTELDAGATNAMVLGADPGLTADFARDEPPVLAANVLLAELAMIQTELPNNQRGVAALPPPGWSASPEFVATVLSGLAGNPLLQAVTPASLFQKVPVAAKITRSLANPGATGSIGAGGALAGDAGSIQAARNRIDALGALTGSTGGLDTDLLVAEAGFVAETQRSAILAAIGKEASRVAKQIVLPPAGSITLTSTRGQLPITVLTSSVAKPRIEMTLTSQHLNFQPFTPPDGNCRVPTPTKEICTFSLLSQNTTLKVPVQIRSSGVFPLDVSITSPGGAIALGRTRDTVRSTAVSGAGIVLIVLAIASLGLWWGRDLRHGRRAGRLVPTPRDGADESPVLMGDDPEVREFFTQPPPEYGRYANS